MIYLLDTHILVWYIAGGERLSPPVVAILDDPEARLLVPTMVLAEAKHLAARKRVPVSFTSMLQTVSEDERVTIGPITVDVVEAMPTSLDIHDGIICGTALVYKELLSEDVRIITRDEAIREAGIVETVW